MLNLILITGLPGTGKTTIIKKLVEDLKNLEVKGFHTEEVRNDKHERIGFDIFSFDGARGVLARSSELSTNKVPHKHKVGKYIVCIEDFEKIALPIFATENTTPLIIDEIGRMELLSVKFEGEIKRLILDIKSNKRLLIATVPSSQRGRPIPVVEELNAMKNTKHFEITKRNRTVIYDQILNDSKEMLKNKKTEKSGY